MNEWGVVGSFYLYTTNGWDVEREWVWLKFFDVGVIIKNHVVTWDDIFKWMEVWLRGVESEKTQKVRVGNLNYEFMPFL